MDPVWYENYDAGVPRSLDNSDPLLPHQLELMAGRFPRNVATEFFGAKLTYGELWDQVLRMAGAFLEMGAGRGKKVAIMLPNCPQTIIAYYAALWNGAVPVLTNPLYVEREMVHQWTDSETEYLVVLDHLYPKVRNVLGKTGIKKVIVTSLREYLPRLYRLLYPIKARRGNLFTAVPYGEDILNFTRLIRSHEPSTLPCTVEPDDLAVLQYTGGTTGIAKGVMLSHRNLVANVNQIIAWFQKIERGKERFVAILPFSHVFGMTVGMNLTLYTGCAAIIIPRFEINEFMKILHKTRPTVFPGVPTIFVAIVNHPKVQDYDLSSIRLCVTGASPMPAEVLRRFEELTGSTIVEGYGLTESSPVTHCNPLLGTRKTCSIGIPLPGTYYRIVDLDLGVRDLPVGEPGELLIRGPQVMKGYWKMPEETARSLRDGWLYTGDIATVDEEGYAFIVDRKKDMIIAGGYNVYPREVDEVLYEHPKVLDAVTVGIPDPYRGETVKAFVVLKPGEEAAEEEIIGFCKEKLAIYKVPKAVEFREFLPKTIVGKVLRKELRREEIAKAQAQSEVPCEKK
mgnify:CR=1 FL=1